MIRAYQVLLKRITDTLVCSPKTHILDNEASYEFKRLIKNSQSCNWFHKTLIGEILQKGKFRHSRIISL